MLWFKLKAGALQLTLFIAVIIALLLTAFVALVHTQKRFGIQTDFVIQTTKNVNQGIQTALINFLPLHDTTIDLENEDYKRLRVHRDYWGIFEKVTSVSTIKKNTIKKVALVGGIQPENNRTALYLEDRNKPLVLIGNTKIEGVAYLPKEGVKSGNISGQSYYGTQLIYGETKTANKLPKISHETITQLETIAYELEKIPDEQFLTIQDGKTVTNSFLNPTKMLFSNSEIRLSNNNLVGNIVVKSLTKIVIEETSKLQDVVLFAPEIVINDNVNGTFQAIATRSIVVGNSCNLNYPSALIINKKRLVLQQQKEQQQNNVGIIINNNTIIKGIVVHFTTTTSTNYKTQVLINEGVEVIGEVYCQGNLELRGSIWGGVFTTHVVVTKLGSVYQNHIYNGVIKSNKLKQQFVGLPFENSKKGIIKWLY